MAKLPQDYFLHHGDYLCYLADCAAWGEASAESIWREEYTNRAIRAAEQERQQLANEIEKKKVTKMRRWEELMPNEQDELVVLEVRCLINMMLSRDPEDHETISNWLLSNFNTFRTTSDDGMRRAARSVLVGELKKEALYQLRVRNFPERVGFVANEIQRQDEREKPPDPTNVSVVHEGEYIDGMPYEFIHECKACGHNVIGSMRTVEYHQKVLCSALPANKLRKTGNEYATDANLIGMA